MLNITGAILKLIYVVSRGDITIHLRKGFREGEKAIGRGLAELMGRLSIAISLLPKVFTSINALDECPRKRLPEPQSH